MANERTYYFHAGPFVISITTPVRQLADYLEHHYQDSLFQPASDDFIDFQIAVRHGPCLRRLIAPQVEFEVNYHRPFKPLPLQQAHAMMEWGLNWVVSTHAHQFFIIHAAVLEYRGQAVIISAPPGSGKSTLCAYLASQGWRLLSDELALVDPNTMLVHGLGRPINLKNSSIELMQKYYPSNAFSPVATDTHKGTVCLLRPPTQPEKHHQPSPPGLLLFVSYQPDEPCYTEPVSPAKALTEVVANTFNFGQLHTQGFKTARELVRTTPAHYLEYNNFSHCEEAIMNLLGSDHGI